MSLLIENNNLLLRRLAELEAVLFVSSEPLSREKLCSLWKIGLSELEELLELFRQRLERAERGLQLLESGQGVQLVTKKELHPQLEALFSRKQKMKLTYAALETLAIIAYRQPITLAEIAQMRGGINSSGALRTLMQKKLVKIGGRKKIAGNPALYVTTSEFLRYFNLNSLEDLPSVEELAEIVPDKEQISFQKEEV